jgi:integrase
MLLPIKPICPALKVRINGTSFIFLQYCYSQRHRTLLNTGIAIPPGYWMEKQLKISDRLPSEYGNSFLLNEELTRQLRVAQDLIYHAVKEGMKERGAFVKATFCPTLESSDIGDKVICEVKKEQANEVAIKKSRMDIYYQLDDYIESKKRRVSKATCVVYGNMKTHLLAFEKFQGKRITFRSLDFNFYEKFVDYLTFEHVHTRKQERLVGLKQNTIGKTIKHLRVFIRDRVKRKIIPSIDMSDFKILEEETDAIYLSHEEIASMYSLDLTNHPELTKYRDLFVLGCLTGLRYSDFSKLRQEDMQKGMLYKKQAKSDHWVIIPLREEAKAIFIRQFHEKKRSFTNPEFNRHIKTIGEMAGINHTIKFSHKRGNKTIEEIKPKYDWISSHTARRSFCTNEFLAGTPVELIMKISGHKSIKDFYKYIRISPEEAANKIKTLWIERNGMRLI